MSTIQLKDVGNITKLCRICLTESKNMTSLKSQIPQASSDPNVNIVLHLLQKTLNTNIILDDKNPLFICPMCLGLLKLSYKLKLQFETSQKLLSKHFGDTQINGDDCESAPVVLIVKGNRYDLNDIIVVEEATDDIQSFDAFLNNLGKTVSASFVKSKLNGEKDRLEKEDISEVVISINQDQPEPCKEVGDGAETKAPQKRSKCVFCSKTFSTRSDMKQHEAEEHNFSKEQDSLMCELCGVVLKSRSSYYHHTLKHSGKQHKCRYCVKKYFNASNLRKHITAVHKNERSHLCTVCGKSFNYANAVDYHMRIHTNERNYKCTYCEKTFRMQCGLSRHLRIHTGARPYTCSFCQQGYRSKGELDCHVMTHTGYRPYHCNYCKKGFTKRYNLKMHLLQHSGQHACYICKKTFAEIGSLNYHYKHVHHIDEGADEGDNE